MPILAPLIEKLRQREGIVRHLGMMVVQTIVEAGCLMLAVLPIANWFGPTLWGELGTFLIAVQLLTMIGDGLYASEIHFVSEEHDAETRRSFAIGWFLFVVTMSITGLLAVLALISVISCAGNAFGSTAVYCLTATTALTRIGKSAIEAVYRARRDFDTPAWAGMSFIIPMAVTLLVCCALGGRIMTYLSILSFYQGGNACFLAWRYLSRMKQAGLSTRFPRMRVLLRDFLRYSAPLMARGIVTFAYLKINLWLIAWLIGTTDAGQYRLADQFLTIPALLMSAVLASFAPRVAAARKRGEPGQLERLSARMYGVMVMIALPFVIGFFFNGLVLTLFFPKYAVASRIIQCFSFVMLVQSVSFASSILLVQGGFPAVTFYYTLAGGIANVGLIYAGAKLFGLWGTVGAMVAVQTLTGLAVILLAHLLLKIRFRVQFG